MKSSKHPHIPFWEPQVGREEFALVAEVLQSNYLNDGEVTDQFEQRLASVLGAKHVITTTSGTTSLFAALVAVGIKPGDEVLVPDVTFIATANAVTLAGASPVLVDVEPDTLTISPAAAAKAVTKKTRAIVPVHLSGRAADMSAIAQLAERYNLHIVEDAAEACGSRYHDGQSLGTIGAAGCFSFSPNKIITTGQGGAVATNDDAIAARLREIKDQGRPKRGTGGADTHVSVGFNFKFTNLQAAVGIGQLELFPARRLRMREIYRRYIGQLRDLEHVRIFGFAEREMPLWIDAICGSRDQLDAHLQKHNIHGRRFWHPLHTQAAYRRPDAQFPVSSTAARHAFWLPSSFLMTDDDIDRVCESIRSFYVARGRGRTTAEAA